MTRSIILCAFAATLAWSAPVHAEDWTTLPKRIARKCGTPPEWVSVTGKDEVHLQVSPDADYSKVDCVLNQLRQKKGIKLGFIGNEADPNRPLNPGWSYIAGGSIATLTALIIEVRKSGWIVGPLAKADDGSAFVTFHTPEGMTEAQATPFADRLRKHQFGSISFGPAPSANGSEFNGE